MQIRNTIAGALTAFGLMGLAISPWVLQPAEIAAGANDARPVSIAISSGPQLRLIRATDAKTAATTKAMICSDVYRLPLADIGLSCHSAKHPSTLALANH